MYFIKDAIGYNKIRYLFAYHAIGCGKRAPTSVY